MEFEAIKARLRALRADLLWWTVSLLLLVACLYYPYRGNTPELGFGLTNRWEVYAATRCPQPEECLQDGDRVLAIGGVDFKRYESDRSIGLHNEFDSSGSALFQLIRQG